MDTIATLFFMPFCFNVAVHSYEPAKITSQVKVSPLICRSWGDIKTSKPIAHYYCDSILTNIKP